jgi:hypothetical protein
MVRGGLKLTNVGKEWLYQVQEENIAGLAVNLFSPIVNRRILCKNSIQLWSDS